MHIKRKSQIFGVRGWHGGNIFANVWGCTKVRNTHCDKQCVKFLSYHRMRHLIMNNIPERGQNIFSLIKFMQDTICIELLRWLRMPFRFNRASKPFMDALLYSILNTIFRNKHSRHNMFEIDQHEMKRCVRVKGNPKSTSHVCMSYNYNMPRYLHYVANSSQAFRTSVSCQTCCLFHANPAKISNTSN